MSPSRLSLWWRLWAVQGSWNRQRMQSLGWLVVLLPWLRAWNGSLEQRRRWFERYGMHANTNPYLAGLVLGVVVHQESEGRSGEALAESLSHSLGSLGDALIWTGIRPALAAWSAVAALLTGPVAAVVGWVAFATGQAWVRVACFERGVREGPEVVSLLADVRVHRATAVARRIGLAGAGALAVAVSWGPLATLRPGPVAALAGGVAFSQLAARRGWQPERVLWGAVILAWVAARIWYSFWSGA